MKESETLDVKALLEEAKASEHGEAYRTLDKNPNFRIGVGVRLTTPNKHSFFVEILLYLCPSFKNADLNVLEKSLNCLKELKSRNYALTCQDGNCVSCEATVSPTRLTEEYGKIRALITAGFG
ncbi:hypothetical protein JW988_06805 [Candidatus Bathyarchaeota archaeon]|nr:hypothetical protein [Candidatus Bathyarchaeota archaeon]